MPELDNHDIAGERDEACFNSVAKKTLENWETDIGIKSPVLAWLEKKEKTGEDLKRQPRGSGSTTTTKKRKNNDCRLTPSSRTKKVERGRHISKRKEIEQALLDHRIDLAVDLKLISKLEEISAIAGDKACTKLS